ncbi:MAG: hypothetical protein JJU09_08735 [Rhodobacteraceae bacterium]|nr:hypothetical protein [Paracoccaceae bacterium]TVR45035.1 MAG: hypothetical protein EA386_13115 [Paracoccaceae bacterium]
MPRLITYALCAALALPAGVQAQEEVVPDRPETEEAPLLEMFEGMLRGFMRDLDRGLQDMEPELERLLDQMRDMTRYHPPEILPNGDILIRRRQSDDDDPDAPEDTPESSDPAPAVPFEL